MSIKPEHIQNIALGLKNHEYRGYLLPQTVTHIWFYTTAPLQQVRYVARVSAGKKPGEVPDNGGLGNDDFNAGKKVSKFAYEILELWELQTPLSLAELKENKYLKGPPQKYCWTPPNMQEQIPLADQNRVLVGHSHSSTIEP